MRRYREIPYHTRLGPPLTATSTKINAVTVSQLANNSLAIQTGTFSYLDTNNIATGGTYPLGPSADRAIVGGFINNSTTISLKGLIIGGCNATVWNSTLGGIGIFSCPFPQGQLYQVPIVATWSGTLFTQSSICIWVVTGLSSLNPIGVGSATDTANTTLSLDLATASGGLITAFGANNTTAAQSYTWSGDQTATKQTDYSGGSVWNAAGLTTNTNDDPANTTTITYAAASTTNIRLAAASWR